MPSFAVPDEPDDESIVRLLDRLNRCPECGGSGSGFIYPVWESGQEWQTCLLCMGSSDLFWDDHPSYLNVILAMEKKRGFVGRPWTNRR